MHFITTIGTFTLSSERHDEPDNIWHTWELESNGRELSPKVWSVLNNLRHEGGRTFTESEIVAWVKANVSDSDF